jgi:HAE1 family hydrophobic/amphiphilic exporter-1
MFISDLAIKRPVLTIVSMLALSLFGIVALTLLDTDEFPEIDAPIVVIAIPYPGASPDIVEREVIEPIEEVISGISGVDRMRSNSLDSFGTIVVEFVFEKDPQTATQEIRDEISSIRNDLPGEMEEPILTRFDPNDQPIVSLTLSSPALTGPELTRMADPDITRRLRSISGVAEVNLVGGIQRELVVEIRPQALQASGISIAQVGRAGGVGARPREPPGVRRRVVPLLGRQAPHRRALTRGDAGEHSGHRRPDGCGQDDPREPHHALLRRRQRAHHSRRCRHPRDDP